MSVTGIRKQVTEQVGYILRWMEPQIHGAPSSLWGPAVDAVRSLVKVRQGLIAKTDSRHLCHGKWKLFEG